MEYPFPEEVLNREYGRLMLKYVGNPHHRNWWKKAEGITKEHEKATRNKFLREMWDEHPEEWIALKARVKLGVEDIRAVPYSRWIPSITYSSGRTSPRE